MIAARQPLRVGHKTVGPHLAGDLVAAVANDAVQIEVRALVLERIPLVLEILLQEIAVADQAQLARQLPAAGDILAMAGEYASAERIRHREITPAEAQVVMARVVDAVTIKKTL